MNKRPFVKIVLMIALLTASCGKPEVAVPPVRSQRLFITGGHLVKPEDPISSQTVLLAMNHGFARYSFCTGTIIAPQFVLTAGHCVAEDENGDGSVISASSLTIIFGNAIYDKALKGWFWGSPLWTQAKQAEAAQIFRHPEYARVRSNNKEDNGHENDIALVRLKDNIPQRLSVGKLLPKESALQPHTLVVLAGYGWQSVYDGELDRHDINLRSTHASISEKPDPQRPDLVHTQADPQGDPHSGACNGDSGGPALIRTGAGLFVWGVLSRVNCAGDSYYVDVRKYIDWIEAVLGSSFE